MSKTIASALLLAAGASAVSITSFDYATNNNEPGFLGAAVTLTSAETIPAKTEFTFTLPNVEDGRYGNVECFSVTLDENQKVSSADILSTTSSWLKKDEGFKIVGKTKDSEIKNKFTVLCSVQAPETSVTGAAGTFKILDTTANLSIDIKQGQIAKSVYLQASGDLTESGINLKIKGSAYAGATSIAVEADELKVTAASDSCDITVDGNKYNAAVVAATSELVGAGFVATIPDTVSIKVGDDVTLMCSSSSKIAMAKKLPAFPVIAGVSYIQSLAPIATSNTLAVMKNSAFTVGAGVALAASTASVLAFFL